MAYLPANPLNQTEFPKPWGKDLALAIRVIEERFRRHHTLIQYHSIKATPSIISGVETTGEDLNVPTGAAGHTKIDPLYGESVEPDSDANWQQPHLSGDTAAATADIEQFEDPIEIHFRVQRDNIKLEAEMYGFDRIRDLIAYAPLSFLDTFGRTIRAGDWFSWDGDPYTVLQYDRVGYWKNTNIRLYMLMNCEHRRHDS